ncbi:MAG: putative toxin-antitoxin system toxin component, PIN family [Bacteroidales bacterium]|nr:putative toxin-antitoxin system toxin component, PIN family [Bacteroidales bacterium]
MPISPFIFQEFQEKLKSKLFLSQGEIKEAVSLLNEVVQMVNPEEKGIKVSGICQDKEDDLIIACAGASGARYLVTGDKDLLAVKEYKGTLIKSPREFELLWV